MINTTETIASRRIGNGTLHEALTMGQAGNFSREDCIWKMETESCTPDIMRFTMYTKWVIECICIYKISGGEGYAEWRSDHNGMFSPFFPLLFT